MLLFQPMKPLQAIQHFGTQQAVADALGVTQSAVGQWFRGGKVPAIQQLKLEAITNGVLVADADIPRGHKGRRRVAA